MILKMENNENNVQNQEKKQSKGLSVGLVVIMLIAVLIIGIGGGYLLSKNDSLFNKNEAKSNSNNSNTTQSNNTSTQNNTIEQSKASKKIDESKPWVYDADYGKDKAVKTIEPWNNEVNPNSKDDLVVPYININSAAGENANKKIKELYEEMYERYATNTGNYGKKGCSLKYKFYENEKILSVVIENNNFVVPGGAGECPLYVYNFNLDTLENATNEELAKQTGYNSISEVNEIVNKWIAKEKTDEEIEESGGTITGLVKDTYFIDENNKLNFVYTVAAAGTYDYYMTIDKAKEHITTSSNQNEQILYTYSSGDNAAANGNGEYLYVYEMNNSVIRFKYHTPWNTNDFSGTATKIGQDLYVYEKDNYKIEILLNSMGENSIKVSEYYNGTLASWKNLWK